MAGEDGGETRDAQHAVSLVPVQVVLDVHGRLRLHCEADEAKDEEEGGVRVALPLGRLAAVIRVTLVEGRPAPRHGRPVRVVAVFVPRASFYVR